MALLPRAIRPMTLLRRRAMRKGLQSDSELFRLIALLLVGRPLLVRQTAFRQGVRGGDRLWKSVAIALVLGDIWRKLFVRQPDRLGVERLVDGETVVVSARPWRERRHHDAA